MNTAILVIRMQENTNILPQTSNPLDHSFSAPPIEPHTQLLHPSTINQMAKEVEKIISRFPYHLNQIVIEPPIQIDNNSIVIEKLCDGLSIGKYNATGQIYRYQLAQKEWQVSKPEVPKASKTQYSFDLNKKRQDDALSVQAHKQSRLAQQSFLYEDAKFPTHNYYIMFDQKNKEKRKVENVLNRTGLQRKVYRLEQQMKELKKTSNSGFHKTNYSKKYSEGRMKLQRLLDSMIQ